MPYPINFPPMATSIEHRSWKEWWSRVHEFLAKTSPVASLSDSATTSGSSTSILGIPSYARYVVVSLDQVSLSAAGTVVVQLGSSSGLVSSGYECASLIPTLWTTATTNGLQVWQSSHGAGTWKASGLVICSLTDATNNVWTMSEQIAETTTPHVTYGAGRLSLGSGVKLDRVGLVCTTGGVTFDAGSFGISYF